MNVGSCPSASRAAASRKLNRLERLFHLGSVFVDRGRLRVAPTRRYAAQGRSVRTSHSSFLLLTFSFSRRGAHSAGQVDPTRWKPYFSRIGLLAGSASTRKYCTESNFET